MFIRTSKHDNLQYFKLSVGVFSLEVLPLVNDRLKGINVTSDSFSMIQSRLNDAAIALHRVLAAANIKYGLFGGFAVSTLGGSRESKDVDCLASASKEQITALLDGNHGFKYIDQSRPDYVAFLWSEKPKDSRAVLVEIFVERFQGIHTILPLSLPDRLTAYV